MYNAMTFSRATECELKNIPSMTAALNEDGTYQVWIYGHDGITMRVPRCQIEVKALTNERDPEEGLFIINIPEGAKL